MGKRFQTKTDGRRSQTPLNDNYRGEPEGGEKKQCIILPTRPEPTQEK